MKRFSTESHGVALVDLLVAAIIVAILMAVAIPNLLNAQVRSDVARARHDMKSIATAMDAYMIDYRTYFPFRYSDGFLMVGYGAYGLTTPVAYMSSLPTDPFAFNAGSPIPLPYASTYEVTTGGSAALPNSGGRGAAGTPMPPEADWQPWPKDMYLMASMGPDRSDTTSTQRFPCSFGLASGAAYVPCYVYDATNGAVSQGEIFRWICPDRYNVIFQIGYDPMNGIDPTNGQYESWKGW